MPFVLFFFIFLRLFHSLKGQQTSFDPTNPYCSQFTDTGCQACAQSDSNTYALYNSICTAINDGDAVSGDQIVRSKSLKTHWDNCLIECDPNCLSCTQGFCETCQRLLGKVFYKDSESFGNLLQGRS